MGRYDYTTECFEKVSVCGIRCEFSDIRIDRSTVPEGKYQYEVAGDDDSGGDPARVRVGILVNFFGMLSATSRCRSGMTVFYGWRKGILYGCRNL